MSASGTSNGRGRVVALAVAIYRRLVRALPATFRLRRGDEVVAVFEELATEARQSGGVGGVIRCLAREGFDVLATAARLRAERLAAIGRAPGVGRASIAQRPGSGGADALRQDVGYAMRSLVRRPGFTAVAVITLALGIGATTAIFSVVNSVILRPLPYPDADRITMFWRTIPSLSWPRAPVSYPNFEDFRKGAASFESLAAYGGTQPGTFISGAASEIHYGAPVTASLFSVLGVMPADGRVLSPDEDRPGAPLAVVLSAALAERLAADSGSMVGRSVTIDRRVFTVVGVMPGDFAFPTRRIEYWVSLAATSEPEMLDDRGTNFISAIGRLRPGVSLAAAQNEADLIRARLAREHPDNADGSGIFLERRQDFVTGGARPVLLVLLGAVGFVLAIACANLANLILARGSARRRELAVRSALGASRGRIIRQLLTESTVIAVLGGVVGVALALAGTKFLLAFGSSSLPRSAEVRVDAIALLFTSAIALLGGLLAGLFPAVRFSRPDLQGDLKGGSQGTMRSGRHRVQQGLVVMQIALALVLLVGAGLFLNSFFRLIRVDPGFEPRGVLAVRLSLPRDEYLDPPALDGFYDRLLERVAALPGVRSVGAGWNIPFSDYIASTGIEVEGKPVSVSERPLITIMPVRGDYFETLGIRLIEGRLVGDGDRRDGPEVVAINEGMARRLWPGESAVGKRFRSGSSDENEPWITVVGVVADVKGDSLDSTPGLQGYWPGARSEWARDLAIVLRTAGDPLALVNPVRGAVRDLDHDVGIVEATRMTDMIAGSVSAQRFRTIVVFTFAAVACLLALVGIYGVMAFLVAERTHEIGLRMALGAQQGGVLRHVLRQGLKLAMIGVALGLVGALAATRVIQAMLFGVARTDPLTYSAVIVLLVSVALLACWIPARRASRVDPLVALRAD